jgi:hypothetical protein
MAKSDRYPIQRTWKRETNHDRVGVDVRPEGDVVLDVYQYTPPRGDYFLSFSAEEWDEIVKAVAEKQREIRAQPRPGAKL